MLIDACLQFELSSRAQLLTYLRPTNSPAGLLINFNVAKLTDGVKRLVNGRYIGPDGEGVKPM
jgi:hypothetical protein